MTPRNSITLQPMAVLAVIITAACSGGGGGGIVAGPSATAAAPVATVLSSPLALGSFIEPVVGAPVAASLGGNAPLIASGAAPNFAAGPTIGTVFPLYQSWLGSDPSEGQIYGSTVSSGATLTFLGNKQVNGATIGTFEFKSSNIDVTLTSDGAAGTIPNSSNTKIGLIISNLTYTLLASWISSGNNGSGVSSIGMGVSGYQTPASGVPTGGTASYIGNGASSGGASGTIAVPVAVATVAGNATVNVNFATGSISGALTNMNVNSSGTMVPWNDVSLSGSLSGAAISGSTAASSSPSGAFSFGAGATGTFNGALYGPNGQELGAVWTLHDTAGGGKSALGLLSATKQ